MKTNTKILVGFCILMILVVVQIGVTHKLQGELYDNTLLLKEVEIPLELSSERVIGYDAILTGEAYASLFHAINGDYALIAEHIAEHKSQYTKTGIELDNLLKKDARAMLELSKRTQEQKEKTLYYLSELDRINIALVDLETKAFEAIEKRDVETANSLLTGTAYLNLKKELYQNYLDWAEQEHEISLLYQGKSLKNSQLIIYLNLGISIGILIIIILTMLVLVSFIKNKEKELELREKAELGYKKLFDETSDAIFIADAKTRQLLDCNKAAENLIGRKKEEIISMKAEELHPKDLMKSIIEVFNKHMGGKFKFMDTWVLTKNKKRIPVRILSSVVLLNGKEVNQGIFLRRGNIKNKSS